MKLRTAAPLLILALAGVPAAAQVNLTRLSPIRACPGGCGPDRVVHAVYPGVAAQGGTGPGADLHLEFPIFNRALPSRAQVQATLVYDSLLWQDVNGAWEPASGGGWWVRSNQGHLTETEQYGGQCGWTDGDGTYYHDETYEYDYYTFTLEEPDGGVYPAGTLTGSPPPHGTHLESDYWDCPSSASLPATLYVADAASDRVVVSGTYDSMTGVAYDRYGDNVSDGFTDPSGNSVSQAGGDFYDPLGLAITETGSGTPSSPIQYKLPGPGGASEYVTVNYASDYVTADFGCYTSYAGYIDLPSSIVYPDGSTYTVGYDSAGRLSSLQLPSGGTITYSHSLSCSGGSVNTSLTQTDPDGGVWSWAHTASPNQTVQTDPSGNTTVTSFDDYGNPTEEDVWQGNYANGGTELRSFSVSTVEGVTTFTTTVFGAPNLYQQSTQTLDGNGFLTGATASNWYTYGNTPALLTQQVNTYAANGNGEVLTSAVTKDGSGNIAAETTYGSFVNGNPETVTRYVNATTSLTTNYTYNANGTVATEKGPNGAQTNFGSYACGSGFFPQSIQDTIGTVSLTWDCNGGLPTEVKGYNGNATSIAYDSRWRQSSVTAPDGAVTTTTYTPTSVETAMPFNYSGGTPDSTDDVLTTLDGMGRPELVQRRQGPGSSSFDTVETCYDELGRATFVSDPYTGAAGQTESCASAGTTTAYDALSRPTLVTNADGGTVSYNYSNGSDVLTTVGPAPAGENTKRRQEEFDGLGRLSSVCEVTSAGGSGVCEQNTNAYTGYLTEYTRNALGEITNVSENAEGTPTESRSFTFDWLGRMTSETNPESGTTDFTFDTDSTCGTSDGNLVKRVDANGTVTCYGYDAANRVTEISYPTLGSGVVSTPNMYFVYDAATVDSTTMANVAGKLAEAYTANPSTPTTHITDLGFSYPNPSSNEQDVYQTSPSSGGWYVATLQHYANGSPSTLTLPVGVPAITYGLDGEGRPDGVTTSGTPATLVNSASTSYSADGLTALALGSGDTDAYTYDSATGRMTQYQFTVGGQTDTGALTWNANGSLASLAITDNVTGTSDSQTCDFTHDDLGRIATANCGSGWDQTFSFDPFGNLSKTASAGTSFSASFNLKNEITSVGGVSGSYDSDGNLLNNPSSSNTQVNWFDADGHATSFNGATVVYDALDRAVEFTSGSTTNEFLYGPSGGKLAVMNGTSLDYALIPLPGGGDAEYYQTSGLIAYHHADWLGSDRLASTPSGSLYDATAYGPFGESYAQTGSDPRFTGKIAAIATGSYDFLMREYSPTQSRWWTPDPAGLAAVDPNNPQTWNEYAYVGGDPLDATDPSGLSPIYCLLATARRGANGACGSGERYGGGGDTIDGVDLGFSLGDELTGGGFSGGGSASSLVCPPGGCDQIVVIDGRQYTPEPTQNGWQYLNDQNGELLSPGTGSEIGLPVLNGPIKPAQTVSGLNVDQTTSLIGMASFVKAYSTLTHPFEVATANWMIAGTGVLSVGTGVGAIVAGCGDPTPFEPATCAASVAGGGSLILNGLGEVGLSYYFFTHATLPAFENWGQP